MTTKPEMTQIEWRAFAKRLGATVVKFSASGAEACLSWKQKRRDHGIESDAWFGVTMAERIQAALDSKEQ